jgi:hypothetical protein
MWRFLRLRPYLCVRCWRLSCLEAWGSNSTTWYGGGAASQPSWCQAPLDSVCDLHMAGTTLPTHQDLRKSLVNPLKDSGKLYVDCVWNVMAHAQKPDFVFRRKGGVTVHETNFTYPRGYVGYFHSPECQRCPLLCFYRYSNCLIYRRLVIKILHFFHVSQLHVCCFNPLRPIHT